MKKLIFKLIFAEVTTMNPKIQCKKVITPLRFHHLPRGVVGCY